MDASVHILLAGSVDYAGLFPPASLSMRLAIGDFAAYHSTVESWMLGRFVCPAARLAELAAFNLSHLGSFRIVLLIGGGNTSADVLNRLEQDVAIDLCSPLLDHCDVVEIRLPADVMTHTDEGLEKFVVATIAAVLAAGIPASAAFFELPLATDVALPVRQQLLAKVVPVLAAQDGSSAAGCRVGLKLRTGGVEAAAFPSSEAVAATICVCRDAGLPWKATAGLHHPLRRFDRSVDTKMHGFLNVLVAAVLADVHRLGQADVVRILEDETAKSFRFEAGTLQWQGLSATTEQIAAARQRSIVSFGSCSFDEPRQDLRALGLLPPVE